MPTKKAVLSDKYEADNLSIYGARAHNLKNVSLSIPRDKLVVFTGLSGSGKSSLAFDTIYAEGQRRYLDTFSTYARQFLGGVEKPPVDSIEGLSPVISIEQKTVNKSPRSTVGTVTEIYDFLRLLYARASIAYSSATGKKMVRYTEEQIITLIQETFKNKKIGILSPLVRGRKGHYKELLENYHKRGFVKVRIDGLISNLSDNHDLNRYKNHDIELVIDRTKLEDGSDKRLRESVKTALKYGKGVLQILDLDTGDTRFFSQKLMCADTGIAYDEPEPNSFSFNSPYGACPKCNGLGNVEEVDISLLVPNKNISIADGAIVLLGKIKNTWDFKQLEALVKEFKEKITTPFGKYPKELQDAILFGSDKNIVIKSDIGLKDYNTTYHGLVKLIEGNAKSPGNKATLKKVTEFISTVECSNCNGTRLKPSSLFFKIDGKNIAEVTALNLSTFEAWIKNLETIIEGKEKEIAKEIILEIKKRCLFLNDVGLTYLSLNRRSSSLSGGEAQRIRLATQIGTQLVGVLYILDEPSIGLHQRDNSKLIHSLLQLRDLGNSIIVVEHDKDMMLHADYIVDIGPGAGKLGGKINAEGNVEEFLASNCSTALYLKGENIIENAFERRPGNGKFIQLLGANGNNLQNVDLKIPLGTLTVVTGVSGSGKSTLINKTLYPIAANQLNRAQQKIESYKEIKGLSYLDKVIDIDQSPIGRTPRSNPATYTKVFDEIRTLFASTNEAKIRGYKSGRFSFNTKGGRCETCEGAGLKKIEMNFLPDVYVECDTCYGKRYNRETLEVRFKGKSISDVLEMTINESVVFFENLAKIYKKVKTLQDVGLGYLKLGQQSTTLSGGEAQRVKLAAELSKRDTGKTLYILDEPSTGLHFDDIKMLLTVLNRLVKSGNTVIVIEHNLDIIKTADYIVDLGPEGGEEGGNIVFSGTPEEMILTEGHTAEYLAKEMH
tara:strand:+ start:64267 stop:67110 length:2844 start_codon:yes stop_codon:yes gene_type:complete